MIHDIRESPLVTASAGSSRLHQRSSGSTNNRWQLMLTGFLQKSKAQRRREKRQSQDQAEQAQIAAEIASVGVTQRQEEAKALEAVLQAHGLQVVDIPVRGNHCVMPHEKLS